MTERSSTITLVHIWDRGIEDGNPVLRCRVCARIWWPDMTTDEAERVKCRGARAR